MIALRHCLVRIVPLLLPVAAAAALADPVEDAVIGEAVERHISADAPLQTWAIDPEHLATEAGDRIEERLVPEEVLETLKLTGVVPPIRFESGVAEIPPSTIATLRDTLEGLREHRNVRLHVVGHADTQALSPSLADRFGDNRGLSRERAGEVAEFLQAALALAPEAIAFEWAGDKRPIASNATAAGRALNRRVEVEIWYDDLATRDTLQDVLVPEDFARVKVCRVQTVCKLRYRAGHAYRARVRNLIPPLSYTNDGWEDGGTGEAGPGVPASFITQVAETLANLENKQNVTVRVLGFTDDLPLTGRNERIYGTHLALSKARAQRVALALKEALGLPNAALESDGYGSERPLASNASERTRALNRRVEVEFWYDDPLKELSDGLQRCPDPDEGEWVARVYDPPWGRIEPLQLERGEAIVPASTLRDLERALADVSHERNPRLRFIGYTANERLDRRTAQVYGDDVGLATARARRALATVTAALGIEEATAEHEGRGFVHSNDVVNAGFLQGDTSHVIAQVVYDELEVSDALDGVDVTPVTRELRPEDPLALNLMRITVDGEPLHDPGRSSADVQRCTDVALDRADIRFQFDNLDARRRLSVTPEPGALRIPTVGTEPEPVRFRTYANYASYIARSEVRVFGAGASLQGEPLAVIEVGADGSAAWEPDAAIPDLARGPLRVVLRAYDAAGRFDETAPRLLPVEVGAAPGDGEARSGDPSEPVPAKLAPGDASGSEEDGEDDNASLAPIPVGPFAALSAGALAGYGADEVGVQNIPLADASTVRVQGDGVPEGHSVWLAGERVPVDERGAFVAEALLPTGAHTVEVAVLDEGGNGELFLRDLKLDREDWFYMGLADLTFSMNDETGPADAFEGANAPVDTDSSFDGRLAFYVNGRFGEDWRLVASADTREGPIDALFSNFLDKSPEALFRRLDPDLYYPTFGDDGVVRETAPTQGKLFLKLSRNESHLLWGNFNVGYVGNELALVERGLYGANLRYVSDASTAFGERRIALDGFAAEPGTVASRDEFRGTGGSLYYLRHQDLLIGSERVRVEIRDKDSGIVTSVVHLQAGTDYDVDPLQGRILLATPLSSSASDDLLVRSGASAGDEAWLVVQYEYTPGFDEVDAFSAGAHGSAWLTEWLKLGLTASEGDEDAADGSLYGTDMTLRATADSWLTIQAGRSEGIGTGTLRSNDGGFGFSAPDAGTNPAPGLGVLPTPTDALAYRADLSIGFADVLADGRGRLNAYFLQREAGYSAPGQWAATDTQQFGGIVRVPITDALEFAAKLDELEQQDGLATSSQELDVAYRMSDHWKLSAGLRRDEREDRSLFVPSTQVEGERTDAVVQAGYESASDWRLYGFAQATVARSGSREENGRFGIGGAYRLTSGITLEGEISEGDLGPAGRIGTRYQHGDRADVYLNYALENERHQDGRLDRKGSLITGARTRVTDGASLFLEERHQRSQLNSGLTHSAGIDLTPNERLSLGMNADVGTLTDRQTGAEIRRQAGGVRAGYAFEKFQLSSGLEYRFDETEQLDGTWSDRTTWLLRSDWKMQLTPDWRLLGKLHYSDSESSLGSVFDGGYTEGVIGYAYRPVEHDRLNVLAKYTYFYNVPSIDFLAAGSSASRFLQKSHIAAVDVNYEVDEDWSVGVKYAYRLGQVSLERESPEFFDNDASLYVARLDRRIGERYEASVELRLLELSDLDESRSGAMVSLYRRVGDHLKVGVGYNFTDFSDDLTDLGYDHQGVFLNLVGTL